MPDPETFVDALAVTGIKVVTIDSAGQVAQALVDIANEAGDGPIGADLETTVAPAARSLCVDPDKPGLDPLLAVPRLISIYPGGERVYVADLYATGLAPWAEFLTKRRLVFYNATFDVRVLLAQGIVPENVDCSRLATGMLTDRPKKFGLINESETLLCIQLPPKQHKRAMQSIDYHGDIDDEALAYAALDAVLSLSLWQAVANDVRHSRPAYDLAADAIVPVARMELAGIPFDAASHHIVSGKWAETVDREEYAFRKAHGLNPTQTQAIAVRLEETLASSVLAEWPRSKRSGRVSLSKAVIKSEPRASVPIVRDFRRSSALKTLNASFGASLADKISPIDGRLRGSFIIAGASTGRFSSRTPNLQNLPKHGGFRRLFRAPEGRTLVVADYAAIELRSAAIESGETTLIDLFSNPPVDADGNRNPEGCPHEDTARRLELDRVTSDPVARIRLSKAVNFGLLFGMGAPTFAGYASIDMEVAEEVRDRYFRARPRLAAWQAKERTVGYRKKWAKTPMDRRVSLRARDEDGKPYISLTRALNVPVQGGAAECMLRAITLVDRGIIAAGIDAAIVATVHDELLIEASVADAPAAARILEEGMRAAFLHIYGGRLGAEECARHIVSAEIMPTWGGDALDPDNLPPSLWHSDVIARYDDDYAGLSDDDDVDDVPVHDGPADLPIEDDLADIRSRIRGLTVTALRNNPSKRVSEVYKVAGVQTLAQAERPKLEELLALLEAGDLPPTPAGPDHARFGPSSASRWIECPGSVEACESAADYAGFAAYRGTQAHTLFEWAMRADIDPRDVGDIVGDDPELAELVAPAIAWSKSLSGTVYVEARMVVDDLADIWGTADLIVVREDEIIVADLKAGKTPVDAKGNQQLGAYAIGARKQFGRRDQYRLVILQPTQSPEPDKVVVNNLALDVLEDKMLAAAASAAIPPAPRYAGSWCRWCRAKGDCETYAERASVTKEKSS